LLWLQIQCLLYQVLKIFNAYFRNCRSFCIGCFKDAVAEVLQLSYVNLRVIDGTQHIRDVLESFRFIGR
jgi:hypothetical protein